MSSFFKNMTYSLAANIINLIISTGTSLLIPLILGKHIEQYGYYQIYLFYIAYIGFFHFGLCDGILLKEGGKMYDSLNKKNYSCQFWYLFLSELIISFIILFLIVLMGNDIDYIFIAIAFGLNLIIYLPRNLLSYILQATNRHRENALITIIGRTIFFSLVLILLTIGCINYRYFVYADIFGKLIALIYTCNKCRDIVCVRPNSLKNTFSEICDNVRVGIKLMLASVSSMVSTGIIRLAIQHYWDIETYAKVSFTLTVTNLVLIFISAISVVLYPTLRKITEAESLKLYYPIRDCLMVVLLFFIILCFPLQKKLLFILPQYSDGLDYLPILFPVCIYSAKISLLIQTYMQVYRLENKILHINVVSIVVTAILTFFSVLLLRNITYTIFSILISQSIRCIYAEYVLSKEVEIHFVKDCVLENILILCYVFISFYKNGAIGIIIYIPLYFMYLLIKKKSLVDDLRIIRFFDGKK